MERDIGPNPASGRYSEARASKAPESSDSRGEPSRTQWRGLSKMPELRRSDGRRKRSNKSFQGFLPWRVGVVREAGVGLSWDELST